MDSSWGAMRGLAFRVLESAPPWGRRATLRCSGDRSREQETDVRTPAPCAHGAQPPMEHVAARGSCPPPPHPCPARGPPTTLQTPGPNTDSARVFCFSPLPIARSLLWMACLVGATLAIFRYSLAYRPSAWHVGRLPTTLGHVLTSASRMLFRTLRMHTQRKPPPRLPVRSTMHARVVGSLDSGSRREAGIALRTIVRQACRAG